MATREEWLALAARCEKATGADREIDDAIWWPLMMATGIYRVIDGRRELDVSCGIGEARDWRPFGPYNEPPRFTASLDAITALIERELPEHEVSSATHQKTAQALISKWETRFRPWPGRAATEALARCAAFCRAMAKRAE